jgi:predicted NBD/HSP70 family sugar kinase
MKPFNAIANRNPSRSARSLSGDQALLRRLNRTALIRLVWQEPGLSRSEVAARLGLTKSSIGQVSQELIHEGWLGAGESSGGTPGRPSIPLSINRERFAMIGIELDVNRLNAVAVDPYGERLSGRTRTGDFRTLKFTLESIAEMITELQTCANLAGRHVLGVGIGAPGPVDLERELLTYAPNMPWENIPLHRLIAEHLPQFSPDKIFVDNDANLAAMSEYMFGPHRNSGDLLFVHLAYGIGGGIVKDHQIYRGAHGFAGEIGHISVLLNGPRCGCGSQGCAETLFSVPALEREMLEAGHASSFAELLERVAASDPVALRVVRRAATYLGAYLVNLANTLDPEVIVVGGLVAELGEAILEPARREMQRRMFGSRHRTLEVVTGQYRLDACAIGAAGFVWQNLLETTELD